MLRRSWLLLTLTLGLLVAPLAADGEQAGKVWRIGILCVGDQRSCLNLMDRYPEGRTFLRGLRETGYVPGKNVFIDTRGMGATYDQLPTLAAELVRHEVHLVVALGSSASAQAAKDVTSTIPIVMAGVPNAVELGLVASLARPGGNITGVTIPYRQLAAKQLELLREIEPRLSRVAVIRNPDAPGARIVMNQIGTAARSLGVQVRGVDMQLPADFKNASSAIIEARANGLLFVRDPVNFAARGDLALFAVRNRLPSISEHSAFASAGGLMSYGATVSDVLLRAATFVGRILNGAKPANLPVEEPTKYELVINLPTAKALGLTIPESILIRADKLIE